MKGRLMLLVRILVGHRLLHVLRLRSRLINVSGITEDSVQIKFHPNSARWT